MRTKRKLNQISFELDHGIFPLDIWEIIFDFSNLESLKNIICWNKSFKYYCETRLLYKLRRINDITIDVNFNELIWILMKKIEKSDCLFGLTKYFYDISDIALNGTLYSHKNIIHILNFTGDFWLQIPCATIGMSSCGLMKIKGFLNNFVQINRNDKGLFFLNNGETVSTIENTNYIRSDRFLMRSMLIKRDGKNVINESKFGVNFGSYLFDNDMELIDDTFDKLIYVETPITFREFKKLSLKARELEISILDDSILIKNFENPKLSTIFKNVNKTYKGIHYLDIGSLPLSKLKFIKYSSKLKFALSNEVIILLFDDIKIHFVKRKADVCAI